MGKAERDNVRRKMLEHRVTLAEIAAEMARRWQLRPRTAWRYAHGWTQEEVAARYNHLTSNQHASMTGKRISDYETWPIGGIKPTLTALLILAKIYDTSPGVLVDQYDRDAMTANERVALMPPQSRVLSMDSATESTWPGPSTELSGYLSTEPVPSTVQKTRLVTSGLELGATLIEIARSADQYLIAVGSRSSEPNYLQAIEEVIARRPDLIHYRILLGPPHNQILKDHLLRLIELQEDRFAVGQTRSIYISIHVDLNQYHERFFVVNEKMAVVVLPSANSPLNFDTGLVIRDSAYVHGLLQHGKALYSKRRLETLDAVRTVEVLR